MKPEPNTRIFFVLIFIVFENIGRGETAGRSGAKPDGLCPKHMMVVRSPTIPTEGNVGTGLRQLFAADNTPARPMFGHNNLPRSPQQTARNPPLRFFPVDGWKQRWATAQAQEKMRDRTPHSSGASL